MTKRCVFIVALLVLLPAADAMAICVGCMTQTCLKPRVGEVMVPQCMSEALPDNGPGVTDCKTVRNCGGCIGFSCYRNDLPPGGVEPRGVLIPEKTTIEIVRQPALAEN
jgi:hypothetical protein